MMVASGTSTPTSITVVATSNWVSPALNAAMAASRSAAFILPCTRPTFRPSALAQHPGAVFGCGEVDLFGFLHQRTDPIGALAAIERGAQMADQFVQPVGTHHTRLHGFAARRTSRDARDIHVAIGGQRQGARDGRRGHHQHIGRPALALQLHALMHAETVLFVHHGQTQILERHIFREQGVGADQDVDLAGRQLCQRLGTARAFLAAGQACQPDAGGLRIRLQRGQMLAHQKLGRRHQCRLQARLHRAQHGQQRHDSLAGTDIALQQPQHALLARHVLFDLSQDLQLRIGQGKGQGGDGPGLEHAGAVDCAAPWVRADWRGSEAGPAGWPEARHRPAAGAPALPAQDRCHEPDCVPSPAMH